MLGILRSVLYSIHMMSKLNFVSETRDYKITINQRTYISDRRDSTPLRLPKHLPTQPLPPPLYALSDSQEVSWSILQTEQGYILCY